MDCIIGIDPGSRSGWAVVTVDPNPKLLLHDAVQWPKPGTKKDLAANTPHAVVGNVIESVGRFDHTIVCAAIEDHFLGLNVNTLKKLARNGGRWEEAFRSRGIPVVWVNPQTWQTAELGTAKAQRT